MERRWVIFVISILVSTCCAINYAFAILTDSLKKDFGFSQTQVDFVGSCGNFGQYFGLISGLVYDRYGPKICLIIGATCVFFGFGMLTLVISGIIPNANLAMVSFFYLIASHSQPWLDNAALVTNMANFPKATGLVVGVGKTFNGLGASIFSLIYSGVFSPDVAAYLLFLTITPPVISLVAAVLSKRIGGGEQFVSVPQRAYYVAFGVTGCLMAYVSSIAFADANDHLSKGAKTALVALLPLFFMAFGTLPFVSTDTSKDTRNYRKIVTPTTSGPEPPPPVTENNCNDSGNGSDNDNGNGNSIGRNVTIENGGGNGYGNGHRVETKAVREEGNINLLGSQVDENLSVGEGGEPILGNLSVLEAVQTSEFSLVFTACVIIAGTGLTVINNIEQIYEAFNEGKEDENGAATYISVLALGSGLGRLLTGGVASIWKARYKWSLLYCISSMIMTVGAIGLSWLQSRTYLAIPSFLCGFAFGMLWASIVPLSRDIYGIPNLAGIYSAINFAPMIGSLALATGITGQLYDHEKRRQNRGENDACIGLDCFQTAFLILAGLGIVSIGCTYALYCKIYGCRPSQNNATVQHRENSAINAADSKDTTLRSIAFDTPSTEA